MRICNLRRYAVYLNPNMQSMAKYRTAFNLLFLAILATAYTGKAFHYHSDEYYTDFERTACMSNGQSSIADDCSICHFSFYSCLYAATPIFAFPVLLLVRYISEPMSKCIEESHSHCFLRAPPVESFVIIF